MKGYSVIYLFIFFWIVSNWHYFAIEQGVHEIFQGSPDRLWGADEPRVNKIVFIGKKLNAEELEKGFKACLLWPVTKTILNLYNLPLLLSFECIYEIQKISEYVR